MFRRIQAYCHNRAKTQRLFDEGLILHRELTEEVDFLSGFLAINRVVADYPLVTDDAHSTLYAVLLSLLRSFKETRAVKTTNIPSLRDSTSTSCVELQMIVKLRRSEIFVAM
jgi:hypothetical protein